jgi:hypothetical protein
MITDIFQVILWITVFALIFSGIDDLYIDIMYWIKRRKYRKDIPEYKQMAAKPEKPIAIMIGAWQEYRVIGRTLTIALNKIQYSNYRIFVAVYPNDLNTVKAVREIARKDKRVILCLNPNEGPTTKADNLNNLYACVSEYERMNGIFDIILIHDSEDFIHPQSLKLYNYMIGYREYMAIQIPVIPIKSRFGKFFHRTYCDAFAELHTKDLIVRQTMNTFMPFAGTGMAFSRNAFFYLEKHSRQVDEPEIETRPRKTVSKNIFSMDFLKKDINTALDKKEKETVSSDSGQDNIQNSGLRIEVPESKSKIKVPVKQISLFSISFLLILFLFVFNYTKSSTFDVTKSNTENTTEENINQMNSEVTVESTDSQTNKDFTISENGYTDESLNVIYLKADDGKFVIQESSWFDLSKASKRLLTLQIFLGTTANSRVVEYDNEPDKIYRVQLGEYNSLEDAKCAALKIRNSKL